MLSYTERGCSGSSSTRAAATRACCQRSSRCCGAGLDAAPTPSLKSAWFSALRDVARTPATLEWLERVWRQAEHGAGPGARRARLHHPGAGARGARRAGVAERSSTSSSRGSQNPDRKARFAVRPAGAVGRTSGARRVLREPERRAEPAAASPGCSKALRYLHHPLRAAASEKYIPAEPRDAARDPAHRGHLLPEALDGRDALRAQLRERRADGQRPSSQRCRRTIPDRLRRIILSSADDLFRASAQTACVGDVCDGAREAPAADFFARDCGGGRR